uniref:Cysteine protease n=1 Tax=Anthurium amnicola TaxID=1678845 RepID=A0A1D1Z3D5_9ARAE
MTSLPDKDEASHFPTEGSTNSIDSDLVSFSSEQERGQARSPKASSWSSFFSTAFSAFEVYTGSSSCKRKETRTRAYGWTTAMRKAITCGSMKRLQERILGTSKTDLISSTSEIWLLGVCYKMSSEESCSDAVQDGGLSGFLHDFSSRIWMTYRKGFDVIGESRFSSDVNWGCMIRSSQMLIAQAMLFHYLGRTWRKPAEKPYEPKYIELLHLFGDSFKSTFSIHNLLQAGEVYGLDAGSWVGPYAMCRSWEALVRTNREIADLHEVNQSFPMAMYVVSGDEDGERGGAPVLCTDVASRLCSEFCKGEDTWAPMLLLVPLVLGLDKVNPRYIPLLQATFTFPQSLGIMGGKPGASTYIVGVQDDKALYLDPHEVQPVVDIRKDSLEANTSSYHCSTVRQLPLDQMDPSLAIGFYCRDKDDFDDFCTHAVDLTEKSNGAPLFTVASSLKHPKPIHHDVSPERSASGKDWTDTIHLENLSDSEGHQQEDEWQLL